MSNAKKFKRRNNKRLERYSLGKRGQPHPRGGREGRHGNMGPGRGEACTKGKKKKGWKVEEICLGQKVYRGDLSYT